MRNWPRLIAALENLFVPDLKLHVQLGTSTQSDFLEQKLERLWITLQEQVVWDFPTELLESGTCLTAEQSVDLVTENRLADIFEFYCETPVRLLPYVTHPSDCWGITDILRSADRRLGSGLMKACCQKMTPASAAFLIAQRKVQREEFYRAQQTN